MRKKFIVAVDDPTAAQKKKLSEYFKGKYGWWHWIGGFWMVTDSTGELTAAMIRDKVGELAPNTRRLVMEIKESGGWAGFGPTTESKNMFKWIRETWSD